MTAKSKSPNFVTAREKGTAGRLLILVATTLFIIFTLCSAYAILLQPTNPAAWSMLAFFVGTFLIVVTWEDNLFPDLPKSKVLPAIVAWFFMFIFVAFFVSFIFTMNVGHLVLAILFGTIVFLSTTYTVTNEQQWGSFKKNTGGRFKNYARNSASKISKGKTAKKKRSKKKKTKKKWSFARF